MVFVISFIDFNMDPSTFWKVLWLISFCRIFDVAQLVKIQFNYNIGYVII
jgi:hypothetical protein